MGSTEGHDDHQHTHAHVHGHGHGHHGHHHDFAEANKSHFNKLAGKLDEWPRARERAQRVGVAIREAVPTLNKDSSTSALEFACGTGLVAQQVYPYIRNIVGVDISPGVVGFCNKRFKEEMGADEKETYAITANLLTEKETLSGKTFDVVYCSSAYHHLEFPAEITSALVGLLKPGGTLLIVDLYQKSGEAPAEVPEEHRHHVTRYGFTEEDMKELFVAAGLEFISYKEIKKDPQDNDLFIAKAVKSVAK